MNLNNLFNYINEILFGTKKSNKDNDKNFIFDEDKIDKSDINIHYYFEYKIKELEYKIKEFNFTNDKLYTFNYDYNTDQYINEFYSGLNNKNINYYAASFNDNKNGLERSQIKTLFAVRSLIYDNNKYIAINGGPGTGKSTLLNYVISNILIDNMLNGYWKLGNDDDFANYIKSENYKKIIILATGSTIASVNNIIELCKIQMPENHIWFEKKIYDFFMNRLDYTLVDKDINEIIEQKIKETFSKNEIEKIKNFFKIKAQEYFDKDYIEWNCIPNLCYEKIFNNCQLIQNINKNIKSTIDKNDDKIIDEYIYQLKLNNKLNKIIHYINNKNISDETKKNFLEESRELLKKAIYDIKEIFQSNSTSDDMKQIINNITCYIDDLFNINKFKLFFKTFHSLKKYINMIKNEFNNLIKLSINKLSETFKNINDSIRTLKIIFNDNELIDMGLLDFVNFDLNNIDNPNFLLTVVSSLKILQINFNIIQKEIDKKIRSENTYLYRHIQEWLFLENKANDLSIIWPIISSNIQRFSWSKIKNNIYLAKKQFNYAIIDESGQTSYKYLLYLNSLANKIIAVGDNKQLQTINDNVNLNSKILDIKNKLNDSHFNEIINILEKYLKIKINYKNKYEYNKESLLDVVNVISNIKSIINNQEYDGLYLLEHFRCPNQIFHLVNKFYYKKILNCPIKDDYSKCSFSHIINEDICCDQCSLIQLRYEYNNAKVNKKLKINYYEIEIGLNFIIDNIDLFIKHYDESFDGIIIDKHIKYLQKNVAFVTLYTNQANNIKLTIDCLIKKILNPNFSSDNNDINYIIDYIYFKLKDNKNTKLISEILSQIKCGTIDALQGIGCDFVVFSNVNKTFDLDNFASSFEFSSNRINVLYTRTKKHFIHILSNEYWNNKINFKNSLYLPRYQAEISLKNNINRVIIEIENLKNLNFNSLILSNKFNFDNKLKISDIGRYGEMILNNIINDYEMKEILLDKIYNQLAIELSPSLTSIWLNKDCESYSVYDYIFNSNNEQYYLDVKASIKNSNSFYLSNNEFNFIKDNIRNYIILKINDISKYNINIKNRSCLSFVIKNIDSYLYDKDIKKFKNIESQSFYKLRNN